MTEQKEGCKRFIEDLARIYLDYLIIHAVDGVNLEEEVTDPNTGEETIQLVNVPQSALEQLKATVKVDITPKSVYDRFAQEQTIENLLISGLFQPQRVAELKAYANALDDESVAPKQKILSIIEDIENEQRKIAMIQAQAQMMQQRAQQFIMQDPDAQAQQIADAQMQAQAQPQIEGEAEVMEEEAEMLENNPDDN
jgi:predicted aldo/keto reductase-like oxidoreductase